MQVSSRTTAFRTCIILVMFFVLAVLVIYFGAVVSKNSYDLKKSTRFSAAANHALHRAKVTN
jgi:ACR3 family arsenite efflux pump ArsB